MCTCLALCFQPVGSKCSYVLFTRFFRSFAVDAAIRDYHIYKEIWSNLVHEEWLVCECEIGNSHDPLSVVMKKLIKGNSTVVGHVPRRISPFCSIFIKRGRSITCIVDGPRRYSADLPKEDWNYLQITFQCS